MMRLLLSMTVLAAAVPALGAAQPVPGQPGAGLGKFTDMPAAAKMMPENAAPDGMTNRDGKWKMGNLPATDAQIAAHKAMMARRKAAAPPQ